MERQVNPKEAAQWAAVILGFLIVWPWVRRITPPPTPTGAEETPCGPGPFTLSDGDARAIADSIEEAATGFTEDEDEIVRQLTRARTDGDVCRLVRTFGRRSVGTLWITYNLPQLVTAYLSDDEVDAINTNYQAKGIQYRF